ncbi:MAG TPA: hypothetical protein VK891_05245 [Euzebyales bacterium]|nr:hypothetical protein [Euzebyales bacterium]
MDDERLVMAGVEVLDAVVRLTWGFSGCSTASMAAVIVMWGR